MSGGATEIDELSIGGAQAALRDSAVIRGATARLEAQLARRISELDVGPVVDQLGRRGSTISRTVPS